MEKKSRGTRRNARPALPAPGELWDRWMLDPAMVFLNHGSFGAVPRTVFEEQERLRAVVEAEPVRFFERRYQVHLDRAREALAEFLGACPDNLAFVCNATTGVNTVLRSLELRSGDEILTTDHEYNACRNAVDEAAAASGAKVVVAEIPFPLRSCDEVVERVVNGLTPRTRIVLVDHVTSQTALVLPITDVVAEVQGRGVDVLVDGAHAPGMEKLDLEGLGAAYYAGNCHKWLCAPRGTAFLHVRADRTASVRPLVISHGANAEVGRRSRFHLEHDWTGTRDPSAWLTLPKAMKALESMTEGGWPEVYSRNHDLVVQGRALLCDRFAIEPPCPDRMIGSMAAIPLPDSAGGAKVDAFSRDALQEELYRDWAIEVPVIPWPAPPRRLIRISAQLYNSEDQYRYLADVLEDLL